MDDDDIVRDVAGKMLTNLGYELILLGWQRSNRAIQEVKNSGRPFDVVIMDLTIPGGMGGRETMQKLLEIDPHVRQSFRAVILTTQWMSNYTNYTKGVIAKPYRIGRTEQNGTHGIIRNRCK